MQSNPTPFGPSDSVHTRHVATAPMPRVVVLSDAAPDARRPGYTHTGQTTRASNSEHEQQQQRRARAAGNNNNRQARSHSSRTSANNNSRQYGSDFGPRGNGNERACARPWRCPCQTTARLSHPGNERACARPWRCPCQTAARLRNPGHERACARSWRCPCQTTARRVGSAKAGDPVQRGRRRHTESERGNKRANKNIVEESAGGANGRIAKQRKGERRRARESKGAHRRANETNGEPTRANEGKREQTRANASKREQTGRYFKAICWLSVCVISVSFVPMCFCLAFVRYMVSILCYVAHARERDDSEHERFYNPAT